MDEKNKNEGVYRLHFDGAENISEVWNDLEYTRYWHWLKHQN